VRSSDWRPLRIESSNEVWFSIVFFAATESSFFPGAWCKVLVDAGSIPQAKTTEFDVVRDNPSIGNCCFHCPSRDSREWLMHCIIVVVASRSELVRNTLTHQ